MPDRQAQTVRNTAARLLSKAKQFGLATHEELLVVRRIKHQAEVDMLMPAISGPDLRDWLWPVCMNFLEVWRELSLGPNGPRADGLDTRGGPSPALEFLEACCQIIDPTVNYDAILYAREQRQPDGSVEDQIASYEAWSESPLAKKLREPY